MSIIYLLLIQGDLARCIYFYKDIKICFFSSITMATNKCGCALKVFIHLAKAKKQ